MVTFRNNNNNNNKLIEKYTELAREASSNGDKILSENYLQHADHFTRILQERETYKKEKFLESKSINSSDEAIISPDQTPKDNSTENIKENTEDKKTAKSQVEIN